MWVVGGGVQAYRSAGVGGPALLRSHLLGQRMLHFLLNLQHYTLEEVTARRAHPEEVESIEG